MIIVEAIIGFGPLVILLGLGLITIPISIVGILDGYYGAMVMLLIEVGGFLGMFAFISVLMHILEPSRYFLSFTKLRLFIICGFCSILGCAFMLGVDIELMWLLIPMTVAVHFIYLGRKYVFAAS
ncbi:hypothetical protein PAUR_a1999 [Pseudoalteromonas aurantia 208]|uniref:Uncharacterized protein n=1 Tax=Pseudoalteromonas aurantia 208 TaxID=1314867 RepID=A0ABR9EC50_9GAMM|nr:hypothetical protein [Pseudoalteromonas aurantia 208]